MKSPAQRTFVLAEFRHAEMMIEAARALRESGEQHLDAYSPHPLHGISEALDLPKSRVPLFALAGGLGGAAIGYSMQWWMNAVDYPINVGGRPLHSAPASIPITFELGVLMAAFAIFFGSLILFGFPRPYHPVFEDEEFRRASVDTFWVSAETSSPQHERALTERLQALGAMHVSTVAGSVK